MRLMTEHLAGCDYHWCQGIPECAEYMDTVTPAEVKSARQLLGLSQAGLAERLRLGANGERTIRRWEAGDVPVTGPASLAIELLVAARRA